MGYWGNLGHSILNLGANIIGVEKWANQYFYKIWENQSAWTQKLSYEQKIRAVLDNPAALFIFTLLSDLYSLGEYSLTREGSEDPIEDHPILDLLKKPNPFQTKDQFMWDYMFFRKLGTANLYIDSKVLGTTNKMYFMHGDLIHWPDNLNRVQKNIILSDASVREIEESILKYDTGTQVFPFKYEKLLQYFDLSNGINGHFSSPSKLDAIYKIILNSENLLKAKNINSEFARKFIVSGQVGAKETAKIPMQDEDKASVESVMRGRRTIYPTRTQVAINRFVEQAAMFTSMDESWAKDAFAIGKMMNIPKDVIEMLGTGATYENQEKARAMIVSYSLQPDADDFCSGLAQYFQLEEQGLKLQIKFDHLPFVQALEKDRADVWKSKADAYMKLISGGVDQQQAADYLGIGVDKFNDPIRLLGSETGGVQE